MNIENFLKNNLHAEKEAWAVAEALGGLAVRGDEAKKLQNEYANDLTHMKEKAMKVKKMVDAVPDVQVKRVLAGRYLYKLSWDEIEQGMNCSKSTLYRYHKQGLEWLEENYEL